MNLVKEVVDAVKEKFGNRFEGIDEVGVGLRVEQLLSRGGQGFFFKISYALSRSTGGVSAAKVAATGS